MSLPFMTLPGRLLVKGNITFLAPQGIPFNVRCKDNAIAFVNDTVERKPTDTFIDGDLVLQGDVYLEE